MLCGGSSSRQTAATENKPVDQSIVAIIDSVDVNGRRIFEKFNQES
jgi:ethanolamine utilization protein EutN/carbon dioxide concentrating mechanism protein CcmL